MPTKEEILKANHAKKVMNWDKVFVQNPSIIESAYEAMDIYAKQECMGLIEFMYASCAETVPYSRPALWKIDLGTEVTFEELYNAYQQSLTT